MIRSPDVICAFCREKGIAVSQVTARHIAEIVLSSESVAEDVLCELSGRDLATGLPTVITFRSQELREAVRRARAS